MTLQQLVMLRHGETDWNALARLQGHRDVDLNEAGRAQARAAAASVAALRPEVIVASDLSGARETADILARASGWSFTVDARLRETNLGDWEGLTMPEVQAGWPADWERWRTSSAHHSPPGGESRWQVALRGAEVVRDLDAGDAERALLVIHGGIVVGLTGLLLDLPLADWGALMGIGNCHWVVLHRRDGRWRLHSYNAGLGGVVIPRGVEQEVAGT